MNINGALNEAELCFLNRDACLTTLFAFRVGAGQIELALRIWISPCECVSFFPTLNGEHSILTSETYKRTKIMLWFDGGGVEGQQKSQQQIRSACLSKFMRDSFPTTTQSSTTSMAEE